MVFPALSCLPFLTQPVCSCSSPSSSWGYPWCRGGNGPVADASSSFSCSQLARSGRVTLGCCCCCPVLVHGLSLSQPSRSWCWRRDIPGVQVSPQEPAGLSLLPPTGPGALWLLWVRAVTRVKLPEEGFVSRNGALRSWVTWKVSVAAEALAGEAHPARGGASLPPRRTPGQRLGNGCGTAITAKKSFISVKCTILVIKPKCHK